MNNYYRRIFPIGLPQEFSFTSIFRIWKMPRVAWHIFQISSRDNIPQFSIDLNPKEQRLDLTIGSYDKYPQTLNFDIANVRCQNSDISQEEIVTDLY